ncbi:MAG: MMPL family transporter [Mesotoga sp.]|uniref:efflux RND transporter permease subunit n=1 Tax=Mesotoga sp. TaxID=2053577 RepID=UPI002621C821|nr:MMPL family transporter [Mesotoga sp.]MDD3680451.1 MMPL family transporter [Mesotoga sp.]
MRRALSFAILAVVVVVLLSGINGFSFDPSPAAFLSDDDSELGAFNKIAEVFGDSGSIVLVLEASQTSLDLLKSITEKINSLEWVKSVLSPTEAVKLGSFNLFTMSIPSESYVYEEEGRLVLNEELLSNPLYSNLIISSDGRYYAVMITIADGNELKSDALIPELRSVLDSSGVESYRLIGESVANSETFRSIIDLTFKYPPFILLAIMAVYVIKFRRISLSLLTLVPPLAAVMVIVGIMGLMELSINSLTVMIPSFIVIIGSAYGMHFLSRFEENIHMKNAVRRTVHEERVPILFSALTTMAGFSSYILLDMKAFQEMGIFVCSGIFLSAIFTITVLPGLVTSKAATKREVSPPRDVNPVVKRAVIWVVIALSIASPLLIITIPMTIDQYNFFKEDSKIRESARTMKEAFGWLTNYALMVEPAEGGSISLTSVQLENLEALEEELKGIEGISKVMSLFDLSRETNVPLPLMIRALNSTDAFGDSTSLLVSDNAIRFNLFSSESDSLSAERLKAAVEKSIGKFPELHKNFDFTLAGTTLIWKSVNSSVVNNQIQSLIVSFGLIILLLLSIFRSLKSTIIATIPILLTTLFNFVFMAFFRISLSISTALISGMLMGLVIDYAIHFTIWFRRFGDSRKAYEQTARAILTNGLSLVAGFSVLLLTPLLLYVDVAKLMVSGLAVGMILTLILLPEIASRSERFLSGAKDSG